MDCVEQEVFDLTVFELGPNFWGALVLGQIAQNVENAVIAT